MSAPEGWIEWSGGGNPVGNARVETRHASGDEYVGAEAWRGSQWHETFWTWSDDDPHRIIAYRLVTAAEDRGDGDFVLMKRGLFYRPNACGYTGIKEHAGRYTKADAESHADPVSGVSAMPFDEAPLIAPNCFADIAAEYFSGCVANRDALIQVQNAEIEHLNALVSRLEETIRADGAARGQQIAWRPGVPPTDAGVIYGHSWSPFRWHPYSPKSDQYRSGLTGRWQTMGEYGGWTNAKPPNEWATQAEIDARARLSARQEGGGE